MPSARMKIIIFLKRMSCVKVKMPKARIKIIIIKKKMPNARTDQVTDNK